MSPYASVRYCSLKNWLDARGRFGQHESNVRVALGEPKSKFYSENCKFSDEML